VSVVTRRGRVRCRARFSRTIRFDTLFMPFHFAAGGRANLLTNDVVDPVSKIPEFKIATARLERCRENPTETWPQENAKHADAETPAR
jgi:assimilatory nitrate reductase catalytic subunit